MENEFDFDSEEIGFDEAEEFTPGESEMFELELTEVNVRTAILQKNNMLALLCVKTADQGGAICRVDPREPTPAVQLYDDPEKAIEWYSRSLRTSRENGWHLVYDGLPLKG